MARKKQLFGTGDFIIWVILALSIFFLIYANSQRVMMGYFESSLWISLSEIAHWVVGGLIAGYLIAKIITLSKYFNRR